MRWKLLIPVKETIVKITPNDLMRMKAAVMDFDRDTALYFVRDLLGRAEAAAKSGLESHLDK